MGGNAIHKDQQFYAYYDAIEETGEVIYCGKGTNWRSDIDKSPLRNSKYNNIQKKYKIIRTRIPTLDEDLALELEDWLMEHYHTWVDDPSASPAACNIDGPGTHSGNKKRSKETCRKLSERQIGEKNHNFGKKQTPEANRKNSESHKNKKITDEHRKNLSKALKGKPVLWNRTKVSQFELLTGKYMATYDSITIAAKETNTNGSSIVGCCTICARYSHSGGFLWRHATDDDYMGIIPPVWSKKKRIYKKSLIPCVAFTKEQKIFEIFESFNNAYIKTGARHVHECCKGIRNYSCNLIWKFLSDVDPKLIEEFKLNATK